MYIKGNSCENLFKQYNISLILTLFIFVWVLYIYFLFIYLFQIFEKMQKKKRNVLTKVDLYMDASNQPILNLKTIKTKPDGTYNIVERRVLYDK